MKGKGISLSLLDCKNDITLDETEVKNFLKEVVQLVKMNPLGEVIIRKGNKPLEGITAVQIIETSHIALHCFKDNISYLFNLESCKDFDSEKLMSFILNNFHPKECNLNALYSINNMEVKND